ncbi:MAG: hypothetical protein KDC07_04340 [Chitinophagaceae bacterium]|nr:hypothetical protein [Chitinophagaceae bacterium]MCB9046235.1 hypothetical protein [Chitinophagales bacterium]
MKSINTSGSKPDWENSLLNDITFIKQKKRYPLNKKTLTPASISAVVWVLLLRGGFLLAMGVKNHNQYVSWVMYSAVLLLIVLVFYQYYRILKFDSIPTKYSPDKNMEMLKRFFTTNNLAFTRHDEAPEVFMIISRNLHNNPNKEHREVMVFIADDKKILVNSHFTGSRFSVTPPSRNYRKMSNELKRWLDTHMDKVDNKEVSVKGF